MIIDARKYKALICICVSYALLSGFSIYKVAFNSIFNNQKKL